MKNRFLVDKPYAPGDEIMLRGEEAHHAFVVRLKGGELVEVIDGKGFLASARVDAPAKHETKLTLLELLPSRELPAEVTLAVSLIHPEKFEFILQKATELGVARFIPLITDRIDLRVERVRGKHGRWEKIVVEATKQCGRGVIPTIEEITAFDALLPRPGVKVMFDADARADEAIAADDAVTALIGPEGGWSERELDAARAAGCRFHRLGPRRLRAETAAIAAAVLLARKTEPALWF